MAKPKLPEVLRATVFKPGHRHFPPKERDPEYVPGRGHFHSEALRMARAMTPAAIRRLGEFAGIDPDTGELIPLERVDIDHRVMQISCLALVERTMGKAREYDPAAEKPAAPEFNPRAYSPEQIDQIEAAMRLIVSPPKRRSEPEVIEPGSGSR